MCIVAQYLFFQSFGYDCIRVDENNVNRITFLIGFFGVVLFDRARIWWELQRISRLDAKVQIMYHPFLSCPFQTGIRWIF